MISSDKVLGSGVEVVVSPVDRVHITVQTGDIKE